MIGTVRVLLVPQDDSPAEVVTVGAAVKHFAPLVEDWSCGYAYFHDSPRAVFVAADGNQLPSHRFNERATALAEHLQTGYSRWDHLHGPLT